MGHFFSHAIGITGGFASGKSTVARSLAEIMGLRLFDADAEVADLIKKNAEGWAALRIILEPVFFDDDDELDKPKLKQAIFADSGFRQQIESVLHPLVRKSLKSKVDSLCSSAGKRSIIEVPLLYEANWQEDFCLVIVVAVADEIAIQRALKRDGVAAAQLYKVLRAQMPLAEKILMADYVVDNNGSWMKTMGQLVELKKNLDTRNLKA
jgi:dephospho-CoA kinase